MNAKRYCAFLLLAANSALATPIYLDTFGREWLDLSDSSNRSWLDAAHVCDPGTGACTGTLITTTPFSVDLDVNGYFWAARDEGGNCFMRLVVCPPVRWTTT